MSSFTKAEENYIDYEVKLRVHDALFKHIDYKFDKLEQKVNKIDHKFNLAIGLIITSIIIPVVLHYYVLL
ncbi:hypothetical protein [Legionella micdadei]|uniref:Uncharacterized protein n=1 Tax=Legionella micdadei TaxID=451 RepID=A0A098GHI7_LEGMI|nr:hypothetical protein [Legionella micdadei]KTD27565.1 hypothetical protein Lmic_1885 [Legionella micdadei]CEG60946.1 protein of unknown function [Legionella micdadei]SCY69346.1 hypothetical protein SAMN02982997_02517 [Legionella micdadei]